MDLMGVGRKSPARPKHDRAFLARRGAGGARGQSSYMINPSKEGLRLIRRMVTIPGNSCVLSRSGSARSCACGLGGSCVWLTCASSRAMSPREDRSQQSLWRSLGNFIRGGGLPLKQAQLRNEVTVHRRRHSQRQLDRRCT